jgi:hypothetical protein
MASARQLWLKEWKSHASLRIINSKGLAFVSYRSKAPILGRSSTEWVMARIRNAVQNIQLSLKQLQNEGLCCNSLTFLKYGDVFPNGNIHPSPIETVQLNFALVNDLNKATEDSLKLLIELILSPITPPPENPRQNALPVGLIIGWCVGMATTAAVTLATGGLSLIPYAAAVGAGVGAAYDAGGRELANRYVRARDQASFSAMEKAIYAVLQLLSTPIL